MITSTSNLIHNFLPTFANITCICFSIFDALISTCSAVRKFLSASFQVGLPIAQVAQPTIRISLFHFFMKCRALMREMKLPN